MSSTRSPAPNVERVRLAGVKTTITWPPEVKDINNGVVFLLPGAMVSISEYDTLRDVTLQHNHVVVSFFVNVLYPFRNNHRCHAQNVAKIFDAFLVRYSDRGLPGSSSSSSSYGIVGHSCGAKVGLLVASIVDPSRVSFVVALDPVDINPIEFTNAKGSNLPLDDDKDDKKPYMYADCQEDESCDDSFVRVKRQHQAGSDDRPTSRDTHVHIPLAITCTDGGLGISKDHDGEAIHKLHPATMCYRHKDAGHMAYCDNGGGWAGMLMPDVGTKEGNEKAKVAAQEIIRELLSSSK